MFVVHIRVNADITWLVILKSKFVIEIDWLHGSQEFEVDRNWYAHF
jgi:hypothetical protein